MLDKAPAVSIGMPVYNDEKYVRRALESILSQSFTDFELIISNNASIDGSSAICEEYARKDTRIRYILQDQNIGPSANFKFLLKEARGEFFMWAASDDLWDADFVRLTVEALHGNKKAALAFSPYTLVDDDEKFLQSRVANYSSPGAVWRLAKLCYYYDDGCFYGMYRRTFLEQVEFPKWKWIFSKSPLNNAYPVLCYVLAQGDYVLVDSKSLWFNRIHLRKETITQKGAYHIVSSNPMLNYAAAIVHKFNVMVVCTEYIYQATKSLGLSILSVFPLFFRCAYECVIITGKLIRKCLRRKNKTPERFA